MTKNTLIIGFKNGKELKFKNVSNVEVILSADNQRLLSVSWNNPTAKIYFADIKEILYIYKTL